MVKAWPYWMERPRSSFVTAGWTLLAFVLVLLTWRVYSPSPSPLIQAGAAPLLLLLASLLLTRERNVEGILILGAGELAEKLYRELRKGNGNGKRKELMRQDFQLSEGLGSPGATLDYDELEKLTLPGAASPGNPNNTQRCGISRIVLAKPSAPDREKMARALIACKLRGVVVEDAVDAYEKVSGKIWLEGLDPEWLIYSAGFRPSRYYLFLKRCVDCVGSALLLLLTAPLLALTAIAVRLDSRGPVFLRQARVGRYGRHFILYKFRSMHQDAERELGPTWAREGDERTTAVGRVLRKFHLDELPQLFNVLRGEMSLIGPRPERPCFVETLRERVPYYDLRHYLQPGITGWAQVMFPYAASIEDAYEKLQYDLYYPKHMSLGCDLLIFLKTLKVVLLGQGR